MIASIMAFALTGPAFAQQTDAQNRNQIEALLVTDSQNRNKIEAVLVKWIDSLNKGDFQARIALQTADAIEITPFGKYTGSQIAESMEKVHKLGLTLTVRVDDIQLLPGGQWAIVSGPYTGSFANNSAASKVEGYQLWVLGQTGGDWKVRASSASRLAPSAPTK
jgi:ketosteroid isomerase-like protein